MPLNKQNQMRIHLRVQLFTGKARNTPGKILEQDWLVENWEKYIELNFKLKHPGQDTAFQELRQMVASRETPDYKGSTQAAKPIPPRRLGDVELGKLEEILPKYEALQRDRWAKITEFVKNSEAEQAAARAKKRKLA